MTAAMLGAAEANAGKPAGRARLRHGLLGRHREHPAGHEDVPGPGPRTHRGASPSRRWWLPDQRARRVRQGRAVLRHRAGAACPWGRTTARTWRPRATAITSNTVVIIGSAPSFPHGVIDPIEELSRAGAQARHRLPHRRVPGRLRAAVGRRSWATRCRLRLPAARGDVACPRTRTSSATRPRAPRSCSTAARSCATHQYFTSTDWPGGLYFSPTFAGSRPGALIAACWAALVRDRRGGLPGRHPAHPGDGRAASSAGIRAIPELRRARRPALRDRLRLADDASTSTG